MIPLPRSFITRKGGLLKKGHTLSRHDISEVAILVTRGGLSWRYQSDPNMLVMEEWDNVPESNRQGPDDFDTVAVRRTGDTGASGHLSISYISNQSASSGSETSSFGQSTSTSTASTSSFGSTPANSPGAIGGIMGPDSRPFVDITQASLARRDPFSLSGILRKMCDQLQLHQPITLVARPARLPGEL